MVCNATRKYIIFQALKKFGQVSYEAQNIMPNENEWNTSYTDRLTNNKLSCRKV